MRNYLSLLVFMGSMSAAGTSAALTLEFSAEVLREEVRSAAIAGYALPIGPFDGQTVPSRMVEGSLEQRAFQLDAPGVTTLAIMAPLRDQIVAAGFSVVFECEARACGGFDFRFGIEVIPEPDMHVDMSDYLFLSAEKDGEVLSLLVSRTSLAAFVQVTKVTDAPVPDSPPKAIVDLDDEEAPREVVAETPGAMGIMAALDEQGRAALDDLVFDTGSSALAEGDYASLKEVAAWLDANPEGTIALVGHTDASGSLAANIALSERRAEAAAQALIDVYGADQSRVSAEGVGFLAPRAPNGTEEGRQKNRRVEVVVTSTR